MEVFHVFTINRCKAFDLSQTQAETLLNRFQYPWEALPHIKEFILALGPSLPKDEYEEIKENVWAAKSCRYFSYRVSQRAGYHR